MPTFDPNNIIDLLNNTVTDFGQQIPSIQRNVLDSVVDDLRKLNLNSDYTIKNSVGNIRMVNQIRGKIMRLILSDDYKAAVKKYLKAFDGVTKMQNEMFRQAETKFKPPAVLGEIRQQTIQDVTRSLTESGLNANIGEAVANILKTNITTGGSYGKLRNQLNEYLTRAGGSAGALESYLGQITTDAINQYSATYMNTVSADLGYEWFRYQGRDITTTRPFCDAMTDQPFFHVSQIPALLKARGLKYTDKKTGQPKQVPLYAKTGLPNGMYPNTTPDTFFVYRGGYNCGHQIFPVQEMSVPANIVAQVKATPEYQGFKGLAPEKKKVVAKNYTEALSFVSQWANQINYDDQNLIFHYTGNAAFRINDYLRYGGKIVPTDQYLGGLKTLDGDQITQQDMKTINELDAVLNTAPKLEGTVMRGLKFRTRELYKSFTTKLKEGEVFSDPAFFSATVDQQTMKTFSTSALSKDKVYITVRSKNGVAVERLSENPIEKEVLFPRNTLFKVVSKKEETTEEGGMFLKLELEEIEL